MSRLADLRAATSLYSFAPILGYTAKGVAYVVHGIEDTAKYKDFQIPKRSGGMRTINAPVPELKRLQKHLAKLLEECISEIDKTRGATNTLSHGFRPNHSIMTNAEAHRKRRYVFNIDLRDFFGAINFGRVWRFFEKQRDFSLHPTIARTIAQIACHNRALPQGSPCSPVISNLIAHILDVRLAQLAAKAGCNYTRYADDLTFSTNRKDFPTSIAQRVGATTQWRPGKALLQEVRRCGFEINPTKTRMQFKHFRQDVTGLIVNSKVNVRTEYAKNTRAMVHSLITSGDFQIPRMVRDVNGRWTEVIENGTEAQLRGMLSFIDSVRRFEQNKGKAKKDETTNANAPRRDIRELDAHARTYRRFLLFTQFYRPTLPLIICEGKTDNVYIRCALRQLVERYPALASKNGSRIELNIGFFSYTKTSDRILHLGGGTGDMCNFISNYSLEASVFRHEGKRHPVIILIDNDSGAAPIFSTIKKATKSAVEIDGSLHCYFIRDNLYVIPLPKLRGLPTAIEDFFEKSVLATKLGGKVFSRTDKFDAATQYGKHLFAKHVIRDNQNNVDFAGFGVVLKRIAQVMAIHSAKP
jgi:retron-type reverse transcriptase/5S rRNA maturation endonuclease (ribonuclease M5)